MNIAGVHEWDAIMCLLYLLLIINFLTAFENFPILDQMCKVEKEMCNVMVAIGKT